MSSLRPVGADAVIADDLLTRRIAGHNLASDSTLADLVGATQPVLLVFLRHYG